MYMGEERAVLPTNKGTTAPTTETKSAKEERKKNSKDDSAARVRSKKRVKKRQGMRGIDRSHRCTCAETDCKDLRKNGIFVAAKRGKREQRP
jgi:ribosome assembly protein YihI (activator of Der GTPase)